MGVVGKDVEFPHNDEFAIVNTYYKNKVAKIIKELRVRFRGGVYT